MTNFIPLALALLLLASPAAAQEKGEIFGAPKPLPEASNPKITTHEDALQIESRWPTAITLARVNVKEKPLDQSYITYSADMSAVNFTGKAYLEMWVQFGKQGFLVSRNVETPLDKDSAWKGFATSIALPKDKQPDELVLNIRFEGIGTLRVKNVKVGYMRGAGPKEEEKKEEAPKEEVKEEAKDTPKEEPKEEPKPEEKQEDKQ